MVAALYRIMWTVALMTPVVLGRKDCRRELMDTDRKTVLLCGPVAAAVFALFLFGEVPALLQIAGGVVTIGGVLLYSQVEKKENDVLKGK